MKDGILVVGSMNLDMVVRTSHIPGPGENICGTGFKMIPGGKGANQAVAAFRLGHKAFLLGCVGVDYFGDFLIQNLKGAGVEPTLVKQSQELQTGVALIAVEEDTGINTIVVDPGANMALSVSDLEALGPYYEEVSLALFQLEIPLEVVAEGARGAHERGLITVLDAGPARRADSSVLKYFDVVSPNQHELAYMTGETVTDVAHARHAADRLLEVGVKKVVVKLGSMGALLATEEGAWHFPPYRVKAVDATAAGDAFTAGLATALVEGAELERAVVFANAAGASAASIPGAQPSMPERGAVVELMNSQTIECTEL